MKCIVCGLSLKEICENGSVGCPNCYEQFKDALMPEIRKTQSGTRHIGLIPKRHIEARMIEIKTELDKALFERNFEKMSVLDAELSKLEGDYEN